MVRVWAGHWVIVNIEEDRHQSKSFDKFWEFIVLLSKEALNHLRIRNKNKVLGPEGLD